MEHEAEHEMLLHSHTDFNKTSSSAAQAVSLYAYESAAWFRQVCFSLCSLHFLLSSSTLACSSAYSLKKEHKRLTIKAKNKTKNLGQFLFMIISYYLLKGTLAVQQY